MPVDVQLICKERTDMVLVNIPIRSGNSGGAVVDSFGRVVGIATVGIEKEIGGMIPASEIAKELEDL
jgi:S1-C subfamily serine protease